jgi:hypothetical protein
MGDGSAFADLLPEEEVDEDLADDVLDGAVTDAGVKSVVVAGEGVHALGGFVGQLVDLGVDVLGGLFDGHGSMLAKWPRSSLCFSSPPYSTAIRASRVSMLRRFVFTTAIDCGARHTRSASVGAACLGSGGVDPTP